MQAHTVGSLALVVLLCIAGCTSFPVNGDQRQDANVTLVMNNTIDTPRTFEVFVVDLPANITSVHTSVGHRESVIRQGVGPFYSGDGFYTEVEPDPNASIHYGNFTVRPGESVEERISTLTKHGALVVVVYDDQQRIIGFIRANCDDLALTYLELVTDLDEEKRLDITFSCN